MLSRLAASKRDIVLNELLRGTDVSEEMPSNTIIIANNTIEILDGEFNDPHTGIWVEIERDPQCLVCGEAMKTDAAESAISLSSLSDMLDESVIEGEND